MEQLPTWLADAIHAAGMTTVYNADDWARVMLAEPANDPSIDEPPQLLN